MQRQTDPDGYVCTPNLLRGMLPVIRDDPLMQKRCRFRE